MLGSSTEGQSLRDKLLLAQSPVLLGVPGLSSPELAVPPPQ